MVKEFFTERWFSGKKYGKWDRLVNWPVLFGVAFVWWLVSFILGSGPVFSPDSGSYIVALEHLKEGRLDLERTPGVPLILWGCEMIAGSGYLWMYCLLQELVFLGSVILLWDMGRLVVHSRGLVMGLTAAYLFLPCLSSFYYASSIDTESFAFGIVMLLLWMSVKILKSWKLTAGKALTMGVALNIVMLFGIAVRAAYIYMIPVYGVFWMFVALRRYHRSVLMGVSGLVGLCGVTYAVWAYERGIEREYGYEGITDISYMNNYFFARENGLLLPELAMNDSLRNELEKFAALPPQRLWNEIRCLERFDHNYREMNRVVTESLKAQPARCASAFLRRSADVGSFRMWDYSFDMKKHQAYSIFIPRMSFLYIFLAVYFGFTIWQWKRDRKFPATGVFLWGFVVCSHLAAIAGAQDEWSRLTYQAFPAVLLLAGKFCSLFRIKRGKELDAVMAE